MDCGFLKSIWEMSIHPQLLQQKQKKGFFSCWSIFAFSFVVSSMERTSVTWLQSCLQRRDNDTWTVWNGVTFCVFFEEFSLRKSLKTPEVFVRAFCISLVCSPTYSILSQKKDVLRHFGFRRCPYTTKGALVWCRAAEKTVTLDYCDGICFGNTENIFSQVLLGWKSNPVNVFNWSQLTHWFLRTLQWHLFFANFLNFSKVQCQ